MVDSFLCAVTGHAPPFIVDIRGSDLAGLARPSVQDVLEYVAEQHHLRCGCDVKIGSRVWLASVALSNADDCEWHVMSRECVALDTCLNGLACATETPSIQLVVAGEQAPAQDYLRLYREKHFLPARVGRATVFTRSGATPIFPCQRSLQFDKLCSIPGSTFVDKSEPLRNLLHHFWYSPVNIIRRPSGFGKTTLLSMFDAYFDPDSTRAYFPFVFSHVTLPLARVHGQLLVFSLDLADLSFKPSMDVDELQAECDRVMDAAAQQFYTRYQDLLCAPEEETARPGFSATFLDITRWAAREGWKLCFTIDNYTAPVLDGPNPAYEWSISTCIFDLLRVLLESNAVFYGLIVGEDVPHAARWCGLPPMFDDITAHPAYSETIGFTLDDIAALDQVFPGNLMAALQSRALTGLNPDAKRIYAASDVLSRAGRLSTLDLAPPAPVRILDFEPVPAAIDLQVGSDDRAADDTECTGADDDKMEWDDKMKRCFADWSDSDDEGDSDEPPLTTDSSSNGSSSSVPSPEAKPSHPTVAEPSSPSQRYDKKFVSSDRL